MQPVKLARQATSVSDTTQLREVLPVHDVYGVIREVCDVKAALLRIGGEFHRVRCARSCLWRDEELANVSAFGARAIRICTDLANLGSLEDLNAVVASVADVKLTVVGQFGAMQRAAEEF